jgi:2-isopropylmalate synthase
VAIPESYPVFGKDAYRTQTGVHAAAILKARAKGHDWLADRVYSGIPAAMVGRRQEVEVGPMSGQANVTCWLQERGIEASPELVQAIFRAAKESTAVLSDERLLAFCKAHPAT